MFRAILYVQWKWTRFLLLACVLGATALPMLTARSDFTGGEAYLSVLGNLEGIGIFYPFLALVTGWVIAAGIWYPDRTGRHVYGMAMPVERWRFVLLRYGAGLLLALVPALALLLANLLVALTVTLPPGLHPYPVALALRFALASMVAFSFMFTLMAVEGAVVAKVVAGLLLLCLLVPVVSAWAGEETSFVRIINVLLTAPGPLSVFTGRWMLIDV